MKDLLLISRGPEICQTWNEILELSKHSRNYFSITLPFKIMVSMRAVSNGNTGAINVVHVIEGNLIGWVCSPKVANWYTKSTNVTR